MAIATPAPLTLSNHQSWWLRRRLTLVVMYIKNKAVTKRVPVIQPDSLAIIAERDSVKGVDSHLKRSPRALETIAII